VVSTLKTGAALIALFLVVTAIADLAGAANLGTAATFGQVAFGIALVAVLLLGKRPVESTE
jgi:hypothetical protein